MNNQIYPRVFDRIKAAFIDAVFIILLTISISNIFALFDSVNENARMISFIFVFILYEPLFISIFGSSFGHMFIGLSVKRVDNPNKNIQFHKALIRFFTKSLLGWISLLTVNSNNKRRAIHDYAANSVVIYLGKHTK